MSGYPSKYSGIYKVKCIQSGGATVRGVVFAQNQIMDLLDKDTDPAIEALDYNTAHRMCTGVGCSITIEISAGRFEIDETIPQDDAAMAEDILLLAALWDT